VFNRLVASALDVLNNCFTTAGGLPDEKVLITNFTQAQYLQSTDVCLSVCLSVRHDPVLYQNGLIFVEKILLFLCVCLSGLCMSVDCLSVDCFVCRMSFCGHSVCVLSIVLLLLLLLNGN